MGGGRSRIRSMEVTPCPSSKRKAEAREERKAALRAKLAPLQARLPHADAAAPFLPQWPHPWLNPEYDFGCVPADEWEDFPRPKR